MANALEREDLNTITLLNSALRRDYGKSTSKQFAASHQQTSATFVSSIVEGVFVPKSAIMFLEVYVVAARALDPRTARDHRENFEDARCIRRIAQALRELVELGGISIELNSVGSHEVKLAHLTRFVKQYLVETNFRGVRLIDESGGVFEINELLLALMKMCGPS
ncbi:hypothetical protein BFJ63_vAg9097 [Fusarium oxysporum f. sp. narcissi]|uniref:Uncharacterized protein n=2 Tax=Fusarium oxysporum TaxID=5507 RepID=A0A4Q2VNL3_FUSOX|nr:hypothetical protein BFJ65_g9473 [Fusarium oxysporum f. sp. cepae]RKK51579.1 hypothetical protein BFJ66_g6076 [Fusarium oxysporum f. sp. cepae]RKK56467.1 hypothetical protein BFJ67_g3752 [Fusarium oxysporum f. sp. cepae]RYC88074.1 hypothetical protein BFJ63_vAg9097 [Fusarium oxysporum f. sp. narcissi]